jgi:hypothetical protein
MRGYPVFRVPTNTKGSQLNRSQWGIGIRDGWEDRDVGELMKWLIPLAVNDLLVTPNNLLALLHDIHVLIRAPAHSKYASKHLHKAGVGAGGRGGTTTASNVKRSHRWSWRASTMSPRILRHYGAKWLMCYILVELIPGHHLNHVLNIGSKSTWSQWLGGDVLNLIHNVLKNIEAHWLLKGI